MSKERDIFGIVIRRGGFDAGRRREVCGEMSVNNDGGVDDDEPETGHECNYSRSTAVTVRIVHM